MYRMEEQDNGSNAREVVTFPAGFGETYTEAHIMAKATKGAKMYSQEQLKALLALVQQGKTMEQAEAIVKPPSATGGGDVLISEESRNALSKAIMDRYAGQIAGLKSILPMLKGRTGNGTEVPAAFCIFIYDGKLSVEVCTDRSHDEGEDDKETFKGRTIRSCWNRANVVPKNPPAESPKA